MSNHTDYIPNQHSQPPFGAFSVAATHRWIVRLTRRLPPHGIAKRLANLLRQLFIKTHSKIVDGELDGLRLRAHLKGNLCERRYFFMPLQFDRLERAFIFKYLRPGGSFVDVGANVGIYSLWAAQAVGSEGHVLSLEPNPTVLERLRFNVDVNGFDDRVAIVPVAAGDCDGKTDLWLHPRNLGGASLVGELSDEAVSVDVRPLLAVLQDAGIDRVDVMKLDIEGYEDVALIPFLNDAPDSLLPSAIIIEDSRDQWRSDLMARLAEAGYVSQYEGRMNMILLRGSEAISVLADCVAKI